MSQREANLIGEARGVAKLTPIVTLFCEDFDYLRARGKIYERDGRFMLEDFTVKRGPKKSYHLK